MDPFFPVTHAHPAQVAIHVAAIFLVYILSGVLPACCGLYLVYFLLTLPMRRNERARLFLDGLEVGLQRGQKAEAALIALSESRDRSFGARFYLVAESLKTGARLSEALTRVPRLLPPRVVAMLKMGERVGDLNRVLPACRLVLKEGVSQVRGALNYVTLVVFLATPALVLVPMFLSVFVMPKYRMVFMELSPEALPPLTRFIFAEQGWLTAIQCFTLVFLCLIVLVYLGGPRLSGWVDSISPGFSDWLLLRMPWKRKRLQRDFSSMLAILMDAGAPEAEAVTLAAEATANRIIARRASDAIASLRQGVSLPEALRHIDDTGELRWRMQNAAHGRGGFLRALAGWHEGLEAKAFQLEQAAAQVTTTVLVLLNGLIVGTLAIGIFLVLIELVNGAVLW